MKLLLQLIAEYCADIVGCIASIGQPKKEPSLLAINVVWFTNCSWIEQLIAFNQIDSYYCK